MSQCYTRTILAAAMLAPLALPPLVLPSLAHANPQGVTILGAPPLPASAPHTARANTTTVPTPVFDTDAAARKPFQAHVDLSLTASKAAITIPPGKRLVVEHMAAVAFASSESGPIQPLVVVYASHGGSPVQDFEYVMTPYALISNQFSLAQQVTIYADTLSISIGFAGYTPIQLAEGVSISGYLVNITAPQ